MRKLQPIKLINFDLFCLTAIISAILTLVYVSSPVPAFACSTTQPASGVTPTPFVVADRVKSASIVLEGTVIDGVTPIAGNATITVAKVKVQQYFKGSGPEIVTINNFGYGPDCLSTVKVGTHRIFYAKGDPNTQLKANYLGAWDAIEPADYIPSLK